MLLPGRKACPGLILLGTSHRDTPSCGGAMARWPGVSWLMGSSLGPQEHTACWNSTLGTSFSRRAPSIRLCTERHTKGRGAGPTATGGGGAVEGAAQRCIRGGGGHSPFQDPDASAIEGIRGLAGIRGGGGGFGCPPPSSEGPPMGPAEGGPIILKRKSSWHRRR